jgi:hypothetical protein
MNWTQITQQVSAFVNAAAPIVNAGVAAFAPEAAAAVSIGEKLLQGAIAEEPAAVALVTQITNGTPLSQAQIQQYEADYEAAYQQTKADIAAKLATAT